MLSRKEALSVQAVWGTYPMPPPSVAVTRAVPDRRRISPRSSCRTDDLPHPIWPQSMCSSPGATCSEMGPSEKAGPELGSGEEGLPAGASMAAVGSPAAPPRPAPNPGGSRRPRPHIPHAASAATRKGDVAPTPEGTGAWEPTPPTASGLGARAPTAPDPEIGSAPGIGSASGIGAVPGIGAAPGIGSASGIGAVPGIGSAPGIDAAPGIATEQAFSVAGASTSGSMRKRSTLRKEMSCSSKVLTARGKMLSCLTSTAKMERTRKPCSTWRGSSGAK
eukprot:scaffold4435_cov88-Isochrysis_galbana.AAC.3